MVSRQSPRSEFDARPLSPSTPASPSAVDMNFLLTASSKTVTSSLERLNDYVQKHYDRFVERESLERNRLIASFAEREKSYENQVSTLKTLNTDVGGLLVREQSTNGELRRKLDIVAGSMARLCKLIVDANLVSLNHKSVPDEIKQEDGLQESVKSSAVMMSPVVALSSQLSQMETIITDIKVRDGSGLPSPVDPTPCNSVAEALAKVSDSLLTTQHSLTSLLGDYKSANAARADAEFQNESLQEKVALLQEELKKVRKDNRRISKELDEARLNKTKHIHRPPASTYPTPAIRDDSPVSLPSPPLDQRDLPPLDDILQGTCNISRKMDHTPVKRKIPENMHTPPQTPIVKAGPPPASMSSASDGRRKISAKDATKLVQEKSTSSNTRNGPLKPPTTRDEKQNTGLSTLPLLQGVKRTLRDADKQQDESKGPTSSLSPSITLASDKTNTHRPHKKRRINGAPGPSSLKNKPANENPGLNSNVAHTSTPSVGPPSTSSKCNVRQLPKTNASDLKSLKFNKTSKPSNPSPASALAKSSSVNTPKKCDKPSTKPLDLARKSPQERAALRKSK